MSLIITSKTRAVRQKPPPGTRVDSSHWLSRHLEHLWTFDFGPAGPDPDWTWSSPPNDRLGADYYGKANIHGYLNSGTDRLVRGVTPYGVGSYYAGQATSDLRSSTMSETSLLTADGGYIVVVYVNNVTKKTHLIGGSNNQTPLHRYGYGIGWESGTAWAFRSVNSTVKHVDVAITTGFNVLACSFSGTTGNFSVNGVSATGTIGSTGQGYQFGLGTDAHTTATAKARNELDGTILLAAQHNAFLSEAQLNEITSNPYGFFQNKRRTYFIPAAGGATTTTSEVPASNLSLTAQPPTSLRTLRITNIPAL